MADTKEEIIALESSCKKAFADEGYGDAKAWANGETYKLFRDGFYAARRVLKEATPPADATSPYWLDGKVIRKGSQYVCEIIGQEPLLLRELLTGKDAHKPEPADAARHITSGGFDGVHPDEYAARQPADAALADEVTENLVALVGRLSHQLSKATPGHRLPVKAMAYLEQIGFKFHVARHGGPEAATQGKEPETIWRWYALDHTGYCYGANPPSNLPERCCLTAFHRHMDATEAAAALRARAVPEGFPRQPNGDGGWVIDANYVAAIRKDCFPAEWQPCEEEVEAVLLAVERERAMLAASKGGA